MRDIATILDRLRYWNVAKGTSLEQYILTCIFLANVQTGLSPIGYLSQGLPLLFYPASSCSATLPSSILVAPQN